MKEKTVQSIFATIWIFTLFMGCGTVTAGFLFNDPHSINASVTYGFLFIGLSIVLKSI